MYLIIHVNDEATYIAKMGQDVEVFGTYVESINIETFVAPDVPSAKAYCHNMLGWDQDTVASIEVLE